MLQAMITRMTGCIIVYIFALFPIQVRAVFLVPTLPSSHADYLVVRFPTGHRYHGGMDNHDPAPIRYIVLESFLDRLGPDFTSVINNNQVIFSEIGLKGIYISSEIRGKDEIHLKHSTVL